MNKPVINLGVDGSEADEIKICPSSKFGQWVQECRGPTNVARIIGVNESTIWRQMQKAEPDPVYMTVMRENKKKVEAKQELYALRSENRKLKNLLTCLCFFLGIAKTNKTKNGAV